MSGSLAKRSEGKIKPFLGRQPLLMAPYELLKNTSTPLNRRIYDRRPLLSLRVFLKAPGEGEMLFRVAFPKSATRYFLAGTPAAEKLLAGHGESRPTYSTKTVSHPFHGEFIKS